MWHQEQKGDVLTYSGTDGHKHVADDLGVVHHDGLDGSVQHTDLQGTLLLLVLQGVLEAAVYISKGSTVIHVTITFQMGARLVRDSKLRATQLYRS